jgi:uncharacterized membrane protein
MPDDLDLATASTPEERRDFRRALDYARRQGLRYDEAQRFVARQRASLRRQHAHTLLTSHLLGTAVLVCRCGMDLAIAHLPLTCPGCQRRWLGQKD